jgi:hypothetical protein
MPKIASGLHKVISDKIRDSTGSQPTDLNEKIMAIRRKNAACVSPYVSLAGKPFASALSLCFTDIHIFQLAQLDLKTSPNETEVSSLRRWPLSSGRRRRLSFPPTVKKRGTKNSPRRCPQPMFGAKSHNLHIFHPNGMPNNRIPSSLAHSRHPKIAKKRQTMKSSLGFRNLWISSSPRLHPTHDNSKSPKLFDPNHDPIPTRRPSGIEDHPSDGLRERERERDKKRIFTRACSRVDVALRLPLFCDSPMRALSCRGPEPSLWVLPVNASQRQRLQRTLCLSGCIGCPRCLHSRKHSRRTAVHLHCLSIRFRFLPEARALLALRRVHQTLPVPRDIEAFLPRRPSPPPHRGPTRARGPPLDGLVHRLLLDRVHLSRSIRLPRLFPRTGLAEPGLGVQTLHHEAVL